MDDASPLSDVLPDIPTLRERLSQTGYLADPGLATALFCAVRLPQPLLLEGEAGEQLVENISAAVSRLRTLDLQKPPGVAEAIDWVHAAVLLGVHTLDADAVGRTLGSVLKYREDHDVASAAGLAWVAGA